MDPRRAAIKKRILFVVKRLLGERRYLRLRSRVLARIARRNRTRGSWERTRLERERRNRLGAEAIGWDGTASSGRLTRVLTAPAPAVAEQNFALVAEALDSKGIDWFVVSGLNPRRMVIGVDQKDKIRVVEALSASETMFDAYATVPNNREIGLLLSSQLKNKPWFLDNDVWSIGRSYRAANSNYKVGLDAACEIEFWVFSDTSGEYAAVAPRENRAAKLLDTADLARKEIIVAGRTAETLEIFDRTMVDDITFPIDVVYTWVDGDDPEWIEQRRRAEAEIAGHEYHPEANHEARFKSRDELRYSLRSIEMFLPWVRNVFLVTNGQLPEWLNLDHPKLRLVRHEEIYERPEHLPTFNSNSIISRLHHIPDLSEHYIYVNDDVCFGRYVSPQQFFYPSGIARVSVSNNRRPFGDPSCLDQPHINLTRNIRDLLEDHFGRTVSRAIKHTPHPQIRSVHFEMQEVFQEAYERTWASRFRHHDDIVADQLFHYYAQIVGRAVPSGIRYNYINILDDEYAKVMESTLLKRNVDAFCINDAPVPGATPIEEVEVTDFLENYFPLKSEFEK